MKKYCKDCIYNRVWNNDVCTKIIGNKKTNEYTGQTISSNQHYLNKKSNFYGDCKYYKRIKKWWEFWK